MDARVISAFTRVFDALLPGHDESRTTAVGTGPFKPYCVLPSWRHSSPDVAVRAC